MFAAVLLTDPSRGGLERASVEALRNAWAGGAVRWLNPGIAAEFPLPAIPENRWKAWEEFQAMRIDLCVVPAAGRRKRLLLADMDSTIIGQECIDELAAEAGVGDRVAAITARAMNGEIGFEGALRERVALLAGLPEAVIEEVLRNRITLAPGAGTLLATLKAEGVFTALVSGGFTAFTGPLAARLGFDEHRANLLLAEGERLTGTVAEPILGRAAKVQALEQIAVRLGIGAEAVLAVGDGANDLGMLKAAGMGVALHAKPKVAAEVDLRVNHGDLTALLYLQGIAVSEFA